MNEICIKAAEISNEYRIFLIFSFQNTQIYESLRYSYHKFWPVNCGAIGPFKSEWIHRNTNILKFLYQQLINMSYLIEF